MGTVTTDGALFYCNSLREYSYICHLKTSIESHIACSVYLHVEGADPV